MNLDGDFYLVELPCGCVADLDDNESWLWLGNEQVACPWCDTVYDPVELAEWAREDREVGFAGALPNPIIRFGEGVLEIVDTCGCGGSIARARPGADEKHITISECAFQTLVLRN